MPSRLWPCPIAHSILVRVLTCVALIAFIAFIALIAATAACSDESNTHPCTSSAECPEDATICHAGACVPSDAPRACELASECLPAEVCVAGYCYAVLSDVLDDSLDDLEPRDVTDAPDSALDTADPPDLDLTPPTVVVSPVDGSTDVPLDVVLTAVFSEPMLGGSVTFEDYFFVRDEAGQHVPSTIVYDPTSRTATLTFTAPLAPWTTYEAHLTSAIVDVAGNGLVEVTWRFSTVAPASAAFDEELARAYAPVFFQDVGDARKDLPVRVDFDADLEPSNNADHLDSGSFDPSVAFSVAETESHFFIQYVLYYPVYSYGSAPGSELEHAVNGVLVVARKDGSRLGALELFQTYSTGYSDGRVDTYVADCAAQSARPFCRNAYARRPALAAEFFHRVPEDAYADAASETAARQVRVYISPGKHELCHFASPGAGRYCMHTPETFQMAQYAELRLLDGAGPAPLADTTTTHLGAYQLTPLPVPWWTSRSDVSSDPTSFYRSSITYTAPSPAQLRIPGDRVPRALATDQPSGNTGMLSPWGWVSGDSANLDHGVTFVDPAYAVQARLLVPSGFAVAAAEYCYNLYAAIDRTSEPSGPCTRIAAPPGVALSPAAGAADVPTDATLTAAFSQPMDPTTLSPASFTLRHQSASTR